MLYPEATEERCTALLVLDIDPVRLARVARARTPRLQPRRSTSTTARTPPRSLLGVALADVFSTARAGRCDSRQELADGPIPLEIAIPVLPCRGGPALAHRLFEPLGLERGGDAARRSTSGSPSGATPATCTSRSRGDVRLADALNQLYVLLPVLDESKHYWQATTRSTSCSAPAATGWPATPSRS